MSEYSSYFGLDLSDRTAEFYEVDSSGEMVSSGTVRLDRAALARLFEGREDCAVALETGTHSRWVQEALLEMGLMAIVANARRLRAIYTNERKSDQRDAEMLARLLRADPQLLSPVSHRGRRAQADLALIKTRDHFVRDRTKAITYVRGLVKSFGGRIRGCGAESFHLKALEETPGETLPAVAPVVEHIKALTERIRSLDKELERIAKERYPETRRLQSVPGVGPLTSLAFVLTLEDPERFAKSRQVGPFLGLVPRRDQSGNRDPRMRITKCGDAYLRRLLVQCAQYLLGRFAPDCALRQWGLRRAESQGRAGKRAAVVAVARKLAVLLHRLWVRHTTFTPYYPNQEPASSVESSMA